MDDFNTCNYNGESPGKLKEEINRLRNIVARLQASDDQRRRAEMALSRELEVNSAIADLSGRLISPANIENISDLTLAYAKDLTGSKYGYVGYIDPQTNYLICTTLTRDIWDACQVPDKNIVFKDFGDLGGWVVKNRKPLLTNSPDGDPRSSGTPPGHIPIERFLSVPAVIEDKLLGMISVANAHRDYTEEDLVILQRLAELYAIALQRKNAEEELISSEERFYKAFHANPTLSSILSMSDGRYIDVNESWLRVMGYTRQEVIGRTSTELNIWVDQGERNKLRQRMARDGKLQNLELKLLAKDGTIRVGLVSAEVIDIGGQRCILAVTTDMTRLKEMEREKSRLNRLNLVGEMAAGITHEIRNPITTVRGFLQMLKEKIQNEQHNKYFDLMIEELDRTNLIITEFLSMAGNKPSVQRQQNLKLIVESLAPLISADAVSAGIFANFQLENTPPVLVDDSEIRQLILNLTRNGLEAMSPGGTLTIKLYTRADNIYLAVRDQGKGIKPEVLKKLGTPFFTTKTQGTGLGLAVCYGIANRHGATISIDTGQEGSTFSIKFASPAEHAQ